MGRHWPAMERSMNQLFAGGLQGLIDAHNSAHFVRFKRLLLVLLGLWMSYFLLVNWFVHALNKVVVPLLDVPLGTYLTVQGAAIVFAVALFRFARTAR
jgi:putative solute:sodium symporter small subunit